MIRYTVHYSGRVQGVGFRYTARQLSRQVRAAGFVENLPDRRVLLVVEGERDQLDLLLRLIAGQMPDYIHDVRVEESAATRQFGEPVEMGVTIRR